MKTKGPAKSISLRGFLLLQAGMLIGFGLLPIRAGAYGPQLDWLHRHTPARVGAGAILLTSAWLLSLPFVRLQWYLSRMSAMRLALGACVYLTAVANFERMPEPFGVYLSLGLMASILVGLIAVVVRRQSESGAGG
jgi:hypothetical protein